MTDNKFDIDPVFRPTHCSACGTKFEKYADLINDPPAEGLRIYYWCPICDTNDRRNDARP